MEQEKEQDQWQALEVMVHYAAQLRRDMQITLSSK